MQTIVLRQPGKIVFGAGCLKDLPCDPIIDASNKILFLVASPVLQALAVPINTIWSTGKQVEIIEYNFSGEPTFGIFDGLLQRTETFNPDCIVGIGGGSVLDCAKLLAALTGNTQKVREIPGINILKGRRISLICLPTTAGTGSEVSPNAILLDENSSEKKGIISPDLIPDACYIDPELTISLPAKLTAETGMDALCHCIEAYTNKYSHPTVDLYAMKGIELIGANLLQACRIGSDIEARSAMALGSMYGGLCLGPVNTSAVHALSYGLGGKYHISHGLANAILLPEVMFFNLPACLEKTIQIALALGVEPCESGEETAMAGIEEIRTLSASCGIPQHLTEIGIFEDSLEGLADIAMNVKRLLNNNPRNLSYEEAVEIYRSLL
jgi:alcohol dehydrogenase class IV